jgi:enoyl-CoA hydratase/carnithine racemase
VEGRNHIKTEQRGGLVWITFERPDKMNAINPEIWEQLEIVLTDCEKDPSIRIILLRGNERAFVAGADVENMVKADAREAFHITDVTMRVQDKLADLPKPSIAVISGYALGAGLELSLCCDFRIAAENAVFGLPEIGLGIIPGGGGTQRLPRLIGLGRSLELICLGERIKADHALMIGLVHRVVSLDRLEEEAERFGLKLAEQPALALRAAKTAIYNGLNVGLKEGLNIEQQSFCVLFGTQDRKEGMAAFMEKRKPKFLGR